MCNAMIIFVAYAVEFVLAKELPYSLKAEKCSIGLMLERRIRVSKDSRLLLLLEGQKQGFRKDKEYSDHRPAAETAQYMRLRPRNPRSLRFRRCRFTTVDKFWSNIR